MKPADALSQAERAERLRQSTAAFDQYFDHTERWFKLRTTMGYVALLVVPLICALAGFVIVNHDDFDARAITLACTALVSAIGLLAAAWRVILATAPAKPTPIEREALPSGPEPGPIGLPPPADSAPPPTARTRR